MYSALRDLSRSRDSPRSVTKRNTVLASRDYRRREFFSRGEKMKNLVVEKLMRKFFTFHVSSLGRRGGICARRDKRSDLACVQGCASSDQFGLTRTDSGESAHVRARSAALGHLRRWAREPFAAVAVVVIRSPGRLVERSSLRAGGRVRECRCAITWE